MDGLPGTPDNIKSDRKGNFYVSLIWPKDPSPAFVHNIGKYPLLRKFFAQSLAVVQNLFTLADSVFPHVLFKKAVHAVSRNFTNTRFSLNAFQLSSLFCIQVAHFETYIDIFPRTSRSATVVKLNKDGKIIDSLHARDNSVGRISELEIVGDYAYLGSPTNTFLARVKLGKQ